MDYGLLGGLSKELRSKPSREPLITLVKEATKIRLNAIRITGNRTPTEKLTETFAEVLVLLQEREGKRVAAPML